MALMFTIYITFKGHSKLKYVGHKEDKYWFTYYVLPS